MSVRITTCPTCGEQTGVYEAGRIESVAANKCKCPPAPAPRTVTEERWGLWSRDGCCLLSVDDDTLLWHSQAEAEASWLGNYSPVRVTLTYTVPEGM